MNTNNNNTNNNNNNALKKTVDLGSSSEDDLLASSQETLVAMSGSLGDRHSTLLPSKNLTNAPLQSDAKTGDQLKKKRKKRKSQKDILKSRYAKAIFILDKIDKNAASGAPHERDEEDRAKYQAVVDECQKFLDSVPSTSKAAAEETERSKRNRSQTEGEKSPKRRKVVEKKSTPGPTSTTTTSARRPFNEVVKDHLLMALATEKDGTINPVVTEWGAIESKLTELVMEHVFANRTGTAPRFDSGEIHRGYRVIKCMDEFSKDFLSKCIAKISGAWEGLSLKLIPAQEIPMRPRARIWLPKMATDAHKLVECLKLQNPDIHMDDWSIIRTEQGDGHTCLILAITESGSVELEKAGFKLFFGVRDAKVKVFRPTGTGSGEADEIEAANSLLTEMKLFEPPPKTNNGA
ncbi:BEACH domain-containing protein lvsA-like [Calliphora vicina]|uniref:BEACH domain-containing protein lvsA-like n=1 Tax=Calliphora vicina TaxID=7373 RepID=UPI00325A6FCE